MGVPPVKNWATPISFFLPTAPKRFCVVGDAILQWEIPGDRFCIVAES